MLQHAISYDSFVSGGCLRSKMSRIDLLKAVALIGLVPFFTLVNGQCPSETVLKPCKCTESASSGTEIICQQTTASQTNTLLKALEAGASAPSFSFELHSNKVQYLGTNFLKDLQVKSAVFDVPSLEAVHLNVFYGQGHNLKSVFFGATDLSTIPTEVLKPLINLKSFGVAKSPGVTSIDSFTFKCKSGLKLEHLRFDSNSISTLEDNAFTYLPSLVSVSLNGNELKDINPKSFPDNMTANSAFSLSASGNQISSLSKDLLQRLPYGTSLNLENNTISEVSRDVLRTAVRKNMHINLKGNKLNCNCDLITIIYSQSALKEDNILEGVCDSPSNVKGKTVSSLAYSDMPSCLLEAEDISAPYQRMDESMKYETLKSNKVIENLKDGKL